MREVFEQALMENVYDEPTHRAFADWLYEHGFDEEAEFHSKWTPRWQKAEDWMREVASRGYSTCINYGASIYEEAEQEWKPITYEDLIQAGHDHINTKGWDYLIQQGADDLRDEFINKERTKEFWDNWSIITGVDLSNYNWGKYGPSAPFSCSC